MAVQNMSATARRVTREVRGSDVMGFDEVSFHWLIFRTTDSLLTVLPILLHAVRDN
jgi:hypothetical protein